MHFSTWIANSFPFTLMIIDSFLPLQVITGILMIGTAFLPSTVVIHDYEKRAKDYTNSSPLLFSIGCGKWRRSCSPESGGTTTQRRWVRPQDRGSHCVHPALTLPLREGEKGQVARNTDISCLEKAQILSLNQHYFNFNRTSVKYSYLKKKGKSKQCPKALSYWTTMMHMPTGSMH